MLTVNNHLGTTSATRCITVEGFKSIERVEEMPLNPINILIGPNGAGKTNLSFRRIGPASPVIILEEPELGLHPYAITRACSARLSLTTRPFSLLCRP